MKVTKQATYSWDAVTNATEQETREFANYLLDLLGEKPVKPNLKFEIAPKETEIEAKWDAAMNYCQSLNLDGKTGWRLPTIEELSEIYESSNNFEKDWYWSSTEYGVCGALYQHFTEGFQCSGSTRNPARVRAIRDL